MMIYSPNLSPPVRFIKWKSVGTDRLICHRALVNPTPNKYYQPTPIQGVDVLIPVFGVVEIYQISVTKTISKRFTFDF